MVHPFVSHCGERQSSRAIVMIYDVTQAPFILPVFLFCLVVSSSQRKKEKACFLFVEFSCIKRAACPAAKQLAAASRGGRTQHFKDLSHSAVHLEDCGEWATSYPRRCCVSFEKCSLENTQSAQSKQNNQCSECKMTGECVHPELCMLNSCISELISIYWYLPERDVETASLACVKALGTLLYLDQRLFPVCFYWSNN